ncbi:MAG: hypothetical protein DMG50_01890 [Acidobacteria bacterium]|nr:MAG: hypothetical protein DMG50_01890 [Acidobacteriota bacterium]
MSLRLFRYVFLGLTASALAAAPCYSQGKGHGKGHEKHDKDEGDNGKHGKYGFRSHDREVVTAYFANHSSNLPPGLAKRGGNLPPGLEKQLERNGTLPPGLQKRLQPCPVEIERQLVPLAPDYRRGFIGVHLVVFNRNTGIIVDVLHDVY